MTEAEQVGVILTEARSRGWPFEDAWRSAIRMLQPPQEADDDVRRELADAREVILETRPYFESAYRGEDPPDEIRATVSLKADERIGDVAPVLRHFDEIDLGELAVEDVIGPRRRLVLG